MDHECFEAGQGETMNDDDQDLTVEEDEKDAVANVPDPVEEPDESGTPAEPAAEVEKEAEGEGAEVSSGSSVEIPVQEKEDDKDITLPEAHDVEGDVAGVAKTDSSDTTPVEIPEGTETDAGAALDEEVTGEEEAKE